MRAAGVKEEGCPVIAPELNHRMQPAVMRQMTFETQRRIE
jgi:hypothetical protein